MIDIHSAILVIDRCSVILVIYLHGVILAIDIHSAILMIDLCNVILVIYIYEKCYPGHVLSTVLSW